MLKFFGRGKDSSDESPPQSSYSPSPSSAPVTGPARPIRLIYCDDSGKFRMDPEAVATLQLVKEPIGIVSVCGRARQGKSFILNQLLGRSSGFQVAATHRPCTKGLWLWSAPIKRTALDGTEYNLLLLDSEGIDAYDQTGTYSTQIFSLAVLLSSMFIYNQMGGIDEAALDRLSLVTQMTKHIRVKAGGRTTASELGQFSPIFVWLLRDFYLDLVEDNRKITPRDYLEIALRPVQGSAKDMAAKNEIRDSIRALFPDRECFTLVRPVNNEKELQKLEQLPLGRLRSEFSTGLDALTKFVFERTRPKQIGATVMTGPVLVGIVQSYIDALNNGAVPTISSSWQSVEEAECQRAYESASETYRSTFDSKTPPEEVALREAHEEAAKKSLAVYNTNAVGVGSARKKYEERLQKFFIKTFEDYKRNVLMEADLQCSSAIQSMEKRLRAACHASDANVDNVVRVLDALLLEYESSCRGPVKWQKLASFLQRSLEGPILDFTKRLVDQIGSEKSTLVLKCRSIEDKMKLLNKQLEDSEKYKSEYLKRYDEAINDKKNLAAEYTNRINNLQGDNSSMKEKYSSLTKTLESTKQEISDWRRKYDQELSKQKEKEDQVSSEVEVLKSRSTAAEARLAAAREHAKSAQKEADDWKMEFEKTFREAKAALEKAATVQDRQYEDSQLREDVLREEFADSLADKQKEIEDKSAKIEYAEQRVTSLKLQLKAAESKMKSYDTEKISLEFEIKKLAEKLEHTNAKAQSYENGANILKQEKILLEQKYLSAFKRFEELEERCKQAEEEAKKATELADRTRAESVIAQKEKSEIQRVAMERLSQIERAERQIQNLERQKTDLGDEVHELRVTEREVVSKVGLLEARVEDREREIESLLNQNNEQRATTVKALQDLLDSERAAHAVANVRTEALSHQLQTTQTKLDELQQELTSVRINETALDNKLKAASHSKRSRADDTDVEMRNRVQRVNKKSRSTTSPLVMEDGGSVFEGNDDNQTWQNSSQEDYTKFTVQKLKQELTKHNFGAELLALGHSSKKDVLALYEKCIHQKS